MPMVPSLDIDALGPRMLIPKVSHALDFSDVPNVYVVDDDGLTARAVNDDPNSETSTVRRGYEHDGYDSAPVPIDGETLAAYARRKLQEASTVEDSRSYEREYHPDLLPYSVVRGVRPTQGLDGTFRITRQSLDMGHGIKVSETAVKEVRTWTA